MKHNYFKHSILLYVAAVFSLLPPSSILAQAQLDSTILKQIAPDLQTAKEYAQIDDFEAASVYLNKAEQTVASIGDTADIRIFYNTIVYNYELYSFEIAQNYTNKLLEISTQKRDTATIVKCYLMMSFSILLKVSLVTRTK